MASEYPAPVGDAGDDPPAPTSTEQLRRRLHVRLERHLNSNQFQPALAVVGFRGTTTDVLRHGIDHPDAGLGPISRPEDVMLGFVLPQEYSAIGVLASSVVATPPQRSHRDAALAIGVDRSGDTVSLLATNDGVIDTSQPHGWLIDACLRSVQLPTAPCSTPALAFPVALWLDRLMVAILNVPSGQPLSWLNAVDLCPIAHRWRSSDPADLGTTLGSTTRSWKALRAATARGVRSPAGISPQRAQWMDDSMFARWCMGAFPDLSNLRGDVEFLAPAEVAENVEIALRAAWRAFAD